MLDAGRPGRRRGGVHRAAAGNASLAARATLAAAGLAFTAALLVLLLAVLRPRLGPVCRDDPEQVGRLAEHGRRGSPGRAVWADDFGPADLLALSRIADAKFWRLRVAVDLFAAGVVLLCAGLLAGVIA